MKLLLSPFVGLALLLGAAAAEAASYEQRLIAHLRTLGYGEITLTFTLLGRAQIVAVSPDDTREIVLNPRTGEILRDFAQTIESDGVAAEAVAVDPIVLPPEIEAAAVLPPDLPPAELPPDPVTGAVPAVPDDVAGTAVGVSPPDAVTPDVPNPTSSSPAGSGSEIAEPDSSTETFDSGVAP